MKAQETRARHRRRPPRCRKLPDQDLFRPRQGNGKVILGVVPRSWPVEAANDPLA